MTDSTKKDEREATVAQTEALMDMIEGVFQVGYKAGKKETGLQMVIASDVIVPAAVEIVIDLVESAKAEAEDRVCDETTMNVLSSLIELLKAEGRPLDPAQEQFVQNTIDAAETHWEAQQEEK